MLDGINHKNTILREKREELKWGPTSCSQVFYNLYLYVQITNQTTLKNCLPPTGQMMKSSQLKINLFIFNHVHIIFAQLWRKNQSLIMTYHLLVLDSVALPITIHNSHSAIFAWNSITLITPRKLFIYLFEEMLWINPLKTNEYQTMFGGSSQIWYICVCLKEEKNSELFK